MFTKTRRIWSSPSWCDTTGVLTILACCLTPKIGWWPHHIHDHHLLISACTSRFYVSYTISIKAPHTQSNMHAVKYIGVVLTMALRILSLGASNVRTTCNEPLIHKNIPDRPFQEVYVAVLMLANITCKEVILYRNDLCNKVVIKYALVIFGT